MAKKNSSIEALAAAAVEEVKRGRPKGSKNKKKKAVSSGKKCASNSSDLSALRHASGVIRKAREYLKDAEKSSAAPVSKKKK